MCSGCKYRKNRKRNRAHFSVRYWRGGECPADVKLLDSAPRTLLGSPLGIEEQFRDAEGPRFGIKLRWTQFTRAEFVERMYLIVGVALLLWTSVGRAVEESEPAVRLESKTKGARLSLARVGAYYWLKMSKQVRLTASFVREHLPPPRLRMFKWLMAAQK